MKMFIALLTSRSFSTSPVFAAPQGDKSEEVMKDKSAEKRRDDIKREKEDEKNRKERK